MAKTRTKQELTRMAWLTEMRRHPERQCKGPGGSTSTKGQVCAMMLLAEMTGGVPWIQVKGKTSTYNANTKKWKEGDVTSVQHDYAAVGARAGLTKEQTNEVISHNDGVVYTGSPPEYAADNILQAGFIIPRKTFAEIADAVDSWFVEA